MEAGMYRKFLFIVFVMVLILGAGGTIFAQRGSRSQETLEVKIASPVPRESPWGRTLDRIAAEWNRITNGQVRLRVLHGGTEGDEEKMFLSLKSNTIQAAVFTSLGLSLIDSAIMTINAPFSIRDTAELNAVMNVIQPELEARLNSGDYFMLAWSKSGFVNFFTKDPVFTPDDLRKQKISSGPEAEEMNTAFKSMGFQIVETGLNEVGQKVATGAVTAVYLPPAGAAAYQVNNYLKNMLPINAAPVVGGIVINQVTWRRIASLDARYQQELLRVTRQLGAELDGSMQKIDSDSINAMTRTGLIINRPSAAQEQLWHNEGERVIPTLLGITYDRELYRKINDVLTQFRNGQNVQRR